MISRAGLASGRRGQAIAPTRNAIRRPLWLLVVVATLATCAGLAADARADDYYTNPALAKDGGNVVSSRYRGNSLEYAWKGPRVIVQGNSTNSDYYYCLGADSPTNWAVVADDEASASLSFTSTSDAVFANDQRRNWYSVTTTNWSPYHVNIRVLSSCTNNTSVFGYNAGPVFEWLDEWISWLLKEGPEGVFKYLLNKAFGWEDGSASSAHASSASVAATAARNGRKRFALRNGTNRISLGFKQPPSSRRPPAIYFTTKPASADCKAESMHANVHDGSGGLLLELDCRGVGRGDFARLKVRKAIRRNFKLVKGAGEVDINLDKPPGKVEPLVYLSSRPANEPCKIRDHDLDLGRRTVDLAIEAHCGKVSRGAIGRLYVGGLLAGRP